VVVRRRCHGYGFRKVVECESILQVHMFELEDPTVP
jgi:hypothetical protein